MLRHYTCSLNMNQVARVLARHDDFQSVTEWGWVWEGGYLLELTNGGLAHIWGSWETNAPWMNEAIVHTDYVDVKPIGPDWRPFELEVDR